LDRRLFERRVGDGRLHCVLQRDKTLTAPASSRTGRYETVAILVERGFHEPSS
jgi:hypothetical protein